MEQNNTEIAAQVKEILDTELRTHGLVIDESPRQDAIMYGLACIVPSLEEALVNWASESLSRSIVHSIEHHGLGNNLHTSTTIEASGKEFVITALVTA